MVLQISYEKMKDSPLYTKIPQPRSWSISYFEYWRVFYLRQGTLFKGAVYIVNLDLCVGPSAWQPAIQQPYSLSLAVSVGLFERAIYFTNYFLVSIYSRGRSIQENGLSARLRYICKNRDKNKKYFFQFFAIMSNIFRKLTGFNLCWTL